MSVHQFNLELANLLSMEHHCEDTDFGDHITALTNNHIISRSIDDKKEQLNQLEDEINWLIISGGDPQVVSQQYEPIMNETKTELEEYTKVYKLTVFVIQSTLSVLILASIKFSERAIWRI